MVLMFLFITGVFYVFWFVARQRSRLKVIDPPMLPGILPLIGHGYLLLGDKTHAWNMLKWVSQESVAKGGVINLQIGSQKIYAITDPDDFHAVAHTCLIKNYLYSFGKAWLGEGLFSGSGPHWKRHRKLLNPAFNQQVLDGFINIFNKQSRRLVEKMSVEVGKGPFDHMKYVSENTLETLFQTVFGISGGYPDFASEYSQNIEYMQDIFTARFQNPWLHSDLIFNMTKLKGKQDKHVKILHELSDRVLVSRKSQMSKEDYNAADQNGNRGKFKPFLDLLLQLSDDEHVMTNKEIREEIDTFMVAGFDTSSYVLLYTIILIGSYPQVQENLYREIQEVTGYSDRDITKLDINKLVYMEAVIKESLRLYPVAPLIARYADCTVKLKNYVLPAGSNVYLLIWGLHRHSLWGPDAEQFKPERWLGPTPINPRLFAGFSVGKRNCIGKTYATMSMKTALAHLLRRYVISADVSKLRLKIDVMVKPTAGNLVTLALRNSKHRIDG